jgi:hypothetical protein
MQGNDKWWTVLDETSAQIALTEIGEALLNKGIPFLGILESDESILGLYDTGEVLGSEIDRDETRLLLANIGANDEARKRLEDIGIVGQKPVLPTEHPNS